MHAPLKFIACTIVCGIHVSVAAQTGTTTYTPKWAVGDKRSATIIRHEQEWKNGELTEESTDSLETHYTVLAATATDYTLEMRQPNVALRSVVELYANIEQELTDYRDLVLKYSVDKATGEAKLLNGTEASAFMEGSIGSIRKVFEQRAPDGAEVADLILAPLEMVFAKEENVEAYMSSQIDWLLLPFGHAFTADDTLRVTELGANPFNPRDTIAQTTLLWLTDADGPGGTSIINSSVLLDLTEFKAMMKDRMKSMAKSFGAKDKAAARKARELDDLEMDVVNTTAITFDEGTTWPTGSVQSTTVTGNDPGGARKKSATVTVVVR